jgi:dTDP-4-dehydrorhamnose reductase
MNKVIVLGDGILGSELIKQTGWDYISRKKDKIDVFTFNKWMLKLLPYDVVVNCIAHTDTYSSDRETHWKVNYEFVDTLVTFCNETNKKLIHISTDYIYANSKTQSSENNIPVHTETWYGYTKLLGDAHVQLKSNNYLIIRESHKPYPFPYKKAWSNQHTNGDYVNIIAGLIIKLINKNSQGVYNVGTSIKTWFNLTKKEFNTTPISCPSETPLDVTMDLSKINNELKNINQ